MSHAAVADAAVQVLQPSLVFICGARDTPSDRRCCLGRRGVNPAGWLRRQVDVYAFGMIAYELFEAAIPFQHLHPVEAARRAAMNHARPAWGATNRCALPDLAAARCSAALAEMSCSRHTAWIPSPRAEVSGSLQQSPRSSGDEEGLVWVFGMAPLCALGGHWQCRRS